MQALFHLNLATSECETMPRVMCVLLVARMPATHCMQQMQVKQLACCTAVVLIIAQQQVSSYLQLCVVRFY